MPSRLDRVVATFVATPARRADYPERPHAAVAVLLAPDPDRLLVIRRAERAGDPWSGQLALPGGRREHHDTDLLATAIRETREETGVSLERRWHRADLDDLAPITPVLPPIVVRPFLFQLSASLPAGISNEVDHASWVGLADLAIPGVYREVELSIRGAPRVVSGYQLEHGLLWGMTERIVTPVVRAWMASDQ